MAVKGGTLAHSGLGIYMLDRNDRTFSKRVYTKQDKHTAE